jgi:hypothetical protein
VLASCRCCRRTDLLAVLLTSVDAPASDLARALLVHDWNRPARQQAAAVAPRLPHQPCFVLHDTEGQQASTLEICMSVAHLNDCCTVRSCCSCWSNFFGGALTNSANTCRCSAKATDVSCDVTLQYSAKDSAYRLQSQLLSQRQEARLASLHGDGRQIIVHLHGIYLLANLQGKLHMCQAA